MCKALIASLTLGLALGVVGHAQQPSAPAGATPQTGVTSGAYVLRVEATSRSGNQFAYREVPFEVIGIPARAMTD